jgi:alanine transaminase
MTDLMCNPPLEGVGEETRELYMKEIDGVYNSLKRRAKLVTEGLRKMRNVTVNDVEGAMYAFPRITFSRKAIEAAGQQSVDQFYCLEMLKNTGIALVPGSGFKQREGTYHFRITTLILPETRLTASLESLGKFNEKFHQMYS